MRRRRFLKSDWPASRMPTEVMATPGSARTAATISRGLIPGRTKTGDAAGAGAAVLAGGRRFALTSTPAGRAR